mmetsp:Transcript_139205/g.242276  ORF Transcript_139205/g.242276 Transcript_139205/m.242276 type:complete len:149 (+) Transcript_139205:82-528(+)
MGKAMLKEYSLTDTYTTDEQGNDDFSTAVLIDEEGAHVYAKSILRGFSYMGFPFRCIGPIALCLPTCMTEPAYKLVSRNRGRFWKFVKRTLGLTNTIMTDYKGSVLGIEDFEGCPKSWAFQEISKEEALKSKEPVCSCCCACGRIVPA